MTVTFQTAGAVSHGIPFGGPPPAMRQALSAVADTLGMSADELDRRLKNGENLAEVASQKGVSREDAISALASALKANAPQGVGLSDDRAKAMATRMLDAKPPSAASSDGMSASGGMARIAEALGSSEDGQDLLER